MFIFRIKAYLFKRIVKDPLKAFIMLNIVSMLVCHQSGHQGLTVDPPYKNID